MSKWYTHALAMDRVLHVDANHYDLCNTNVDLDSWKNPYYRYYAEVFTAWVAMFFSLSTLNLADKFLC